MGPIFIAFESLYTYNSSGFYLTFHIDKHKTLRVLKLSYWYFNIKAIVVISQLNIIENVLKACTFQVATHNQN